MNFLYPILFLFFGFIIAIYPAILLVTHIIDFYSKEDREAEWRILAAKLALTEYRMIQEINMTRQQMGMDPIRYSPVVAKLKGRFWTGLMLKVQESVRNALKSVSWRST